VYHTFIGAVANVGIFSRYVAITLEVPITHQFALRFTVYKFGSQAQIDEFQVNHSLHFSQLLY
jgi:hypothetical protein